MKPALTTCLVVLLAVLVGPALSRAETAEPIAPLKGTWACETINGTPPQGGMQMTMTFLTDKLLRVEVTVGKEKEDKGVQYKATDNGKRAGDLTFFYDPQGNPEGSPAKWEVKADKKLYITNEGGDVLCFKKAQ